jgi:hypothetical protein
MRWWYSPDEIVRYFTDIGPSGLHLYAWTQVTLDVVFPLVYGTLILVCVAKLFSIRSGRQLLIVPVLAVLFDLMENGIVAYLAFTFTGVSSRVGIVAAMCTLVKLSLVCTSLAIIVLGAARQIWSNRAMGA